MSENREPTAGGEPVEETEASQADLQAAVERANDPHPLEDSESVTDSGVAAASAADAEAGAAAAGPAGSSDDVDGDTTVVSARAPRPEITGLDELPSAAEKEKIAAIETAPYDPIADNEAQQYLAAKSRIEQSSQSDEITINKDHPMAALYLQAPAPPEPRGNRGAGVLISLLATIVFAIVYAGVISLGLAPHYPPSTFLSDGLLPHVTSIGFIASVAGFLLAMVLLVLIVGRAGWWAYVLGGFWVAALVLAAATIGYGYSPQITGLTFNWQLSTLLATAMIPQVLAAALVAREVSVWFGAWIGGRGRKMTARNRADQEEYEKAVAEAKRGA